MATDKTQLKIKKKTWYPVFTNKAFGETFIGEVPLTEPNLLLGRCIQTNLMNITDNPKNQNISLKFKIEKTLGGKGIAYPVSYSMMSTTIKRLARRKKDRIDDSFQITTSDGIKMMIKPLFITKSQTTNAIERKIRKTCKNFLLAVAASSNYMTLFIDIVNYRVQRVLKNHLKMIYPLAVCEIRMLELLARQNLGEANEEIKRAKELTERKNEDNQGQKPQQDAKMVQASHDEEGNSKAKESAPQETPEIAQ